MKTLLRTRQNLPIFRNWTHKNMANRLQCAHFRKSQKIKITPPYSSTSSDDLCLLFCLILLCSGPLARSMILHFPSSTSDLHLFLFLLLLLFVAVVQPQRVQMKVSEHGLQFRWYGRPAVRCGRGSPVPEEAVPEDTTVPAVEDAPPVGVALLKKSLQPEENWRLLGGEFSSSVDLYNNSYTVGLNDVSWGKSEPKG